MLLQNTGQQGSRFQNENTLVQNFCVCDSYIHENKNRPTNVDSLHYLKYIIKYVLKYS